MKGDSSTGGQATVCGRFHLPGWEDMKGAGWEEEITSFAYEKLGVPSRKFHGPEAVGYPHRSYGEANWGVIHVYMYLEPWKGRE